MLPEDAPDPLAPLGERLARLEGEMDAEDRIIEHSLESVKTGQNIIIAVTAVVVAVAVALLVYILNRMDMIAAAITVKK